MSRVDLFNSVTITIEGTAQSYNTYTDWGLYIVNTDIIGEPKQSTKYVEVPGRTGVIDLSETLSGRIIYKSRELKIILSGAKDKTTWNSVMSTLRNHINGKVCHFVFDDDTAYFWRGRVDIKDFSSVLNKGVLTVDVPMADPYKYDVTSSTEPWLWDPFNFKTGVITQTGSETIVGSGSITIPKGHMLTCPDIVVSEKLSSSFYVEFDGVSYELTTGSNIIPSIMIGGDTVAVLNFTGSATVQVAYRGGSL